MDEKNITVVEENEDGFTLLELFRMIKSNIILLLVICLAFFVIGVVYTFYLVTPMYTASVDLKISVEDSETSGSDTAKFQTLTNVKKNIIEYIKLQDVIYTVIIQNDLDTTITSVRSRISASSLGEANIVRISYEDISSDSAKRVVVLLVTELARRINLDKTQEGNLRLATEQVELINKPLEGVELEPTSPNKPLNIIISILLGGIIGVVAVILKEMFGTRFTSKNEIEILLKLPVLIMVPAREDGDMNA